MEATAALAERALAARLLVEDDSGSGYELANDLVREVLYQTSPGPTRVARHRTGRRPVPGGGRPA